MAPRPPSLEFPAAAHLRAAMASLSPLLARLPTPLLISGALAVVLAQLGLYFSVELNEKAPLGYLLLLALGVAAFALGSLGHRDVKRAAGQDTPSGAAAPPDAIPGFNVLDSAAATLAVMIGGLAMAVLLVLLGAGSVSGYMMLPWVVALVAFAAPFRSQFASFAVWVRLRLGEHWRDVLIPVALMGAFIALALYDLQDWYYSVIGDEFLFLEHARHITEEGVTRPFSQEGVYNNHPVMSSVFQAAVMWVFGADYFGWTFSETLNAALTIPGIYVLGHAIGGRKAALVSSVLFCFSHFVLAFPTLDTTAFHLFP